MGRALGPDVQRQLAAAERDLDRDFPELHRERQVTQAARKQRVEAQGAVADLDTRVVPLHHVERPGHDTQVDPFLRGAALDVVDIAA
jgi:hypothetical protein